MITIQELEELIENAGYRTSDYSVGDRPCLGFIVERGAELAAVAEIVSHNSYFADELVALFRTAKVNTMGRNLIVYFPGMRYE